MTSVSAQPHISEIRTMCKVCDRESQFFDQAEIMGKYRISYFRCHSCGLIATEEPYWLTEAYSDAISRADIGLIGRNVMLARRTNVILQTLFPVASKFVDYGGGYGMFVRMMRDSGFDFFRQDKYCRNLFAAGFDVEENPYTSFDLLTAFEVFEHLSNPAAELAKMLSWSSNILFTTCTIPKHNPPKPNEWWYYVRHSGQHLTLYTLESLHILAERNNLSLCSVGDIHFMNNRNLSNWLFKALIKGSRPLNMLLPKRESLLSKDYFRLTGELVG